MILVLGFRYVHSAVGSSVVGDRSIERETVPQTQSHDSRIMRNACMIFSDFV